MLSKNTHFVLSCWSRHHSKFWLSTTVAGFKGLGFGTEEAIELVKLSVRLAVQARNEFLEAKASGALTLRGITLGKETPDGVKYFSEGALPNRW